MQDASTWIMFKNIMSQMHLQMLPGCEAACASWGFWIGFSSDFLREWPERDQIQLKR